MKKVFILAALTGVVAFTSCNGNSNNDNTATEAGQKVDELVNDAKDALNETADSISAGVDKATDSLNAAADSLTDGK